MRFMGVALVVLAACAGDDGAHCKHTCPIAGDFLDIGNVPYASLADTTITIARNYELHTAPVPIPENGNYQQSVVLGIAHVLTEASDLDTSIANISVALDYTVATANATDAYGLSIQRTDGSQVLARNWTTTVTLYSGCYGETCVDVFTE